MRNYPNMNEAENDLSPIDEAFRLRGFEGDDYIRRSLKRRNPIAKHYGIEIEMNTEKIKTGQDYATIFKFIHMLATTPELQYRVVDSLFQQALQKELDSFLEGRKEEGSEITLDLLKDSFSLIKLKLLDPYKMGKHYLLRATFSSPVKARNGKLYNVEVDLAVFERKEDPFSYFIRQINFCSCV